MWEETEKKSYFREIYAFVWFLMSLIKLMSFHMSMFHLNLTFFITFIFFVPAEEWRVLLG